MYAGWLMERPLDKLNEYKFNHAYIDKEKKYRVIYGKQLGMRTVSGPEIKKDAKRLFNVFDDAVEIVKIIQRRKKTET